MNDIQQVLFNMLCDIDDFCTKHDIPYYLVYGTTLGAVRHQGFIPWDDDVDIAMTADNYARFLELASKEPIGNSPDLYFIQTQDSDPHFQCTWTKIRRNQTAYITQGDAPFEGHLGLWIDVFPFYPAAKTRTGRKLQLFESKAAYILAISEDKCKKPYRIIRRMLFPVFGQKRLIRFLMHRACRPRKEGPLLFLVGDYFFSTAFIEARHFGQPDFLPFEGRNFPCPTDSDGYLTAVYGDYHRIPSPDEIVTHDALFSSIDHSYTEFVDQAKKAGV